MIKVELENKKGFEITKKLFQILGSSGLPLTRYSVMWATDYFQNLWVNNIIDAKTKTGWKTFYINRIKKEFNGDYESKIYAEPHKFINFIEKGISSFPMFGKDKGFPNAKRVKKTKDGIKYITVIMQKRKREIQSKTVKKELKNINHYRPIGTKLGGKEKIYSQSQSVKSGVGIEKRMTKIGSPKHSGFGTFRIVTEKSKGWIYPTIPGVPIFLNTVEQAEPKIKEEIKKAFIKDLNTLQKTLK